LEPAEANASADVHRPVAEQVQGSDIQFRWDTGRLVAARLFGNKRRVAKQPVGSHRRRAIPHYGSRCTTPVRLATRTDFTGLPRDAADFEEVGAKLGAELDALYISMVDAKTAGSYEGIEDLIESSPWT